MSLHAIVVAAILSRAPAVGEDRAREIAAVTVSVAEASPQPLVSALALVTVNLHESTFRKSVEDCTITGDGGKAISSYQLHREHFGGYTRAEICASPALAARLALRALEGHHTVRGAMAAFVGAPLDHPEVARRVKTFEGLLAEAKARKGGDS